VLHIWERSTGGRRASKCTSLKAASTVLGQLSTSVSKVSSTNVTTEKSVGKDTALRADVSTKCHVQPDSDLKSNP